MHGVQIGLLSFKVLSIVNRGKKIIFMYSFLPCLLSLCHANLTLFTVE